MDNRLVELNDEMIFCLECLRFEAYKMKALSDILDCFNTIHALAMREKRYLVYGSYFKGELLAACYVSSAFHSLYIEQLFVRLNYQNKGFGIGKGLLSYVLNEKTFIKAYFKQDFSVSMLCPASKNTQSLFETLGYREDENGFCMRKTLL